MVCASLTIWRDVRDHYGRDRWTSQDICGHLGRDLVLVGQAVDGIDLLRRCLGTVRELSDVLLGQTRRSHPGASVC